MATATVMAFSKACRVRMSRGRTSSASRRINAWPAWRLSSNLRGVGGGNRRIARQGHAQGFYGGGHGVGGEQAGAGALSGAGAPLQVPQLVQGHILFLA